MRNVGLILLISIPSILVSICLQTPRLSIVFLKMLGVKFPNLRSLNLEQNGILCSIYHRDVLHSFGLNPSVMITWLSAQTQDIDYDSSSNFSFQFDEDDEEEDTDEDDHHSSDIFTANCDETMAHLYDHD
eukprot:925836_1